MTRQTRYLHHTCCAPYRSTTSRENCGNAGTYSRLRPRPPEKHRHGGLGLHTPADIHYGTAEAVRDKRAAVLTDAYRAHPERFIHKPPEPPHLPTGSWINPPDKSKEVTQ
jgi:hypothetical protein